jgi:hypothetical protein
MLWTSIWWSKLTPTSINTPLTKKRGGEEKTEEGQKKKKRKKGRNIKERIKRAEHKKI